MKYTILEILKNNAIDPEEREIEAKGHLMSLLEKVLEKTNKTLTTDKIFDLTENLYYMLNPDFASDEKLTLLFESLLKIKSN